MDKNSCINEHSFIVKYVIEIQDVIYLCAVPAWPHLHNIILHVYIILYIAHRYLTSPR